MLEDREGHVLLSHGEIKFPVMVLRKREADLANCWEEAMDRAQETALKWVKVHSYGLSTHTKDAVSISCPEQAPSTGSPHGTAPDPTHNPVLGPLLTAASEQLRVPSCNSATPSLTGSFSRDPNTRSSAKIKGEWQHKHLFPRTYTTSEAEQGIFPTFAPNMGLAAHMMP